MGERACLHALPPTALHDKSARCMRRRWPGMFLIYPSLGRVWCASEWGQGWLKGVAGVPGVAWA